MSFGLLFLLSKLDSKTYRHKVLQRRTKEKAMHSQDWLGTKRCARSFFSKQNVGWCLHRAGTGTWLVATMAAELIEARNEFPDVCTPHQIHPRSPVLWMHTMTFVCKMRRTNSCFVPDNGAFLGLFRMKTCCEGRLDLFVFFGETSCETLRSECKR